MCPSSHTPQWKEGRFSPRLYQLSWVLKEESSVNSVWMHAWHRQNSENALDTSTSGRQAQNLWREEREGSRYSQVILALPDSASLMISWALEWTREQDSRCHGYEGHSDWDEKAHLERGQHHFMGLGPGLSEQRTWTEHELPSPWFLTVDVTWPAATCSFHYFLPVRKHCPWPKL